MTDYYCEFCNKNIAVEDEPPQFCNKCGFVLIQSALSSQEVKNRDQECQTYCENCDSTVYAVAVGKAILTVRHEAQLAENYFGGIMEVHYEGALLLKSLEEISQQYDFICNKCFKGLNLK